MNDSNEIKDSSSPRGPILGGLANLIGFDNNSGNDDSDEQLNDTSNYGYGSVGSSYLDNSAATLVASNNSLGNILEDEELLAPIPSDDEGLADTSDDDEELDGRLSQISAQSFHLGDSTRISNRNIMVLERRTDSFLNHGDFYELVPTQLKNNIRMIEDVNLIDNSKGRLYLARYSFFNNGHDLKFALTVQPDIYKRIMSEVSDAVSSPFGVYFCCHGGDGAHSGVSHKDYVDIKLAWICFGAVMIMLMAIDLLVEEPSLE